MDNKIEDIINDIIDEAEYKNPSVGEEDSFNARIYISAHKIAKEKGLDTTKLNVPEWTHKKEYY